MGESENHGARPGRDIAQVLAKFRAGASKSELARELGVSMTRVTQILEKAMRKEVRAQRQDHRGLAGLSVGARNCLLAQNLTTGPAIHEAMESGRLHLLAGMDPTIFREVRVWLRLYV